MFGVLKLRGLLIDVGLLCRELKSGLGYCLFDVLLDLNMMFGEVVLCWDFMFNVIVYDLLK